MKHELGPLPEPRDMEWCEYSADEMRTYAAQEVSKAVAALSKDAERYRWLLANHVGDFLDDGDLCLMYVCSFEHYNDVSASIDAAMGEKL